jgi:hypothetical protein
LNRPVVTSPTSTTTPTTAGTTTPSKDRHGITIQLVHHVGRLMDGHPLESSHHHQPQPPNDLVSLDLTLGGGGITTPTITRLAPPT